MCNPAFNDAALQEDPESKRTSRESGIYGSSCVHEDNNSFPSTSHASQSDVLNNNDADIPVDFLMGSYKTFDNQPKSRQHLDFNARRSYPRASSNTSDKSGQPVGRYAYDQGHP